MANKWKLKGYDTFSDEEYSLLGDYDDELSAREAAAKRLKDLERTQPSSQSGGQTEHGIQDQVYIVRPDGTMYMFTG